MKTRQGNLYGVDVSSFSDWGRLYFSYYTKYYTTLAEKGDNHMYSIHNTHNTLHSTQTVRKCLFTKVGRIHRTRANMTSVTSTYAQRILHVTTIRRTVTNYITTTVSNYLFSRCAALVEWTQLIGWSAVISAATFATLAVGDHKRSSTRVIRCISTVIWKVILTLSVAVADRLLFHPTLAFLLLL